MRRRWLNWITELRGNAQFRMKTKAYLYTVLFTTGGTAGAVAILLGIDSPGKWLAPLFAVLAVRSYRDYKRLK